MTLTAAADACSLDTLHAGVRVKLCNLANRPELNGSIALAASFDKAKGRYAVKIDGFSEPMLLKPDNLTEYEGNPLSDVD